MHFTEIFNRLSRNEKRFFLLTCITAILLMAGWILLSTNGVMNYRAVEKQLQTVEDENMKLAAENEKLKIEIEKLKSDPAYLEEVARKDYGLVKKNEMVFDFD